MTAPYLGGFRLGTPYYIDRQTLMIPIAATHWGAELLYQAYAGRDLVGVTRTPFSRVIAATIAPALWPRPLQVLAVTPANRHHDYGPDLPPRPYNVARLNFTIPAHATWTDAKYVELTAGTTPGGAVDDDNVLARELYRGAGTYTFDSGALPGSGDWNFELTGVDDKPAAGNRGTAVAMQAADVLAHPPDVAIGSNGTRLTGSITAQTLTVGFAYQ